MGHKHIYSIKKNEILVSPMTMPDFLPAMKKAAAFVTDEGGINLSCCNYCSRNEKKLV
jgi:phosphoenolpyruvate synthase/pyruvate phosphate dikinase